MSRTKKRGRGKRNERSRRKRRLTHSIRRETWHQTVMIRVKHSGSLELPPIAGIERCIERTVCAYTHSFR